MKAILILLVASVTMANAQQMDDTTALRNISREKFTWMIEKQTGKLKQLLDENVQYIHSNGWIETKAEVVNDIISGKLNYVSVNVASDTVRIFKKTGIVTGRGLFKVTMDGKEVELKLLYTEVYIKQKKHWILVQRNACKL